MSVQQQVPADHPMMQAWTNYTTTEAYANTKLWAVNSTHTEGSLWAAFCEGWNRRAPAVSAERPGRADITNDGLHEIGTHRRWLARQLLDSNLSDAEAYGIVRHHPACAVPATPEGEARDAG